MVSTSSAEGIDIRDRPAYMLARAVRFHRDGAVDGREWNACRQDYRHYIYYAAYFTFHSSGFVGGSDMSCALYLK
jgi:hypothetical protein